MIKNISIIMLAIITFISSFLYYIQYNKQVGFDGEKKENCKVNEIDYTISGESMTPLIKNGAKLKVLENYYKCSGKVERGDVIIYRSSTTGGDIIKQIKALPGDKIRFNKSTMILNGEPLKNSSGSLYSFSDQEIKLMSAYLSSGALQDATFFAFGDNVSNSIDSRKIGGIGVNNFVGKVVMK